MQAFGAIAPAVSPISGACLRVKVNDDGILSCQLGSYGKMYRCGGLSRPTLFA
jgi:hypothetical protein